MELLDNMSYEEKTNKELVQLIKEKQLEHSFIKKKIMSLLDSLDVIETEFLAAERELNKRIK